MLKTKTKTTTMMMAVVMTLTRPVLLSITLKVVGQRNLGRGCPVRAQQRLRISHHAGLSTQMPPTIALLSFLVQKSTFCCFFESSALHPVFSVLESNLRWD